MTLKWPLRWLCQLGAPNYNRLLLGKQAMFSHSCGGRGGRGGSWAQGTQWEKRSLHRWSPRSAALHFVSAAHARWAPPPPPSPPARDPLGPLADMSAFYLAMCLMGRNVKLTTDRQWLGEARWRIKKITLSLLCKQRCCSSHLTPPPSSEENHNQRPLVQVQVTNWMANIKYGFLVKWFCRVKLI